MKVLRWECVQGISSLVLGWVKFFKTVRVHASPKKKLMRTFSWALLGSRPGATRPEQHHRGMAVTKGGGGARATVKTHFSVPQASVDILLLE